MGDGVAAVGTGTNGVMVGVATLAVGETSVESDPLEHAVNRPENTNIISATVLNFLRVPFLTT